MAIIDSVDELKKTVKVTGSSPFEVWQIFLADAQDQYLIPYLSSSLVAKLEGLNIASPSGDDEKYIKILPLVKRVLGPFAVMLSTDEMSINTGDNGHTVTRSDRLAPASDAKIAKAAESLQSRAWQNLESLLLHLEENVNDFPEWKESKFFRYRQTNYFPSAEIFQDAGLIDIEYSRLTFEKLRQLIISIEKTEVKPLLTDAGEKILFEDTADSALMDKQCSMMEKVRAYIGARVGELHTSQKTRLQRSKNNNLEYKAIIRPLYSDDSDTQNYYATQAAYWKGEIISMLPELGIDVSSSKVNFDNEGKHIFSAIL